MHTGLPKYPFCKRSRHFCNPQIIFRKIFGRPYQFSKSSSEYRSQRTLPSLYLREHFPHSIEYYLWIGKWLVCLTPGYVKAKFNHTIMFTATKLHFLPPKSTSVMGNKQPLHKISCSPKCTLHKTQWEKQKWWIFSLFCIETDLKAYLKRNPLSYGNRLLH